MRAITGKHYLVLWSLFHCGQYIPCVAISYKCRLSTKDVSRMLKQMRDSAFCGGEQWVDLRMNKGFPVWYITGVRGNREGSTGGWAALHESADNPIIVQSKAGLWKDEVLTGITIDGKQSKIDNAVI